MCVCVFIGRIFFLLIFFFNLNKIKSSHGKKPVGALPCLVSVVYFRSSLLLYSAGSGVNRVQVVLSGFSVRLFCFVETKTLC